MIPTILCIAFIVYLFWADHKLPNGPSMAVWIPFCWMFLAGSRYVSSWLGLRPAFGSASDVGDGSPVDAFVFFVLILAGAAVLVQRLNWRAALQHNPWILIYLVYCLLSATWADDSLLLFKRWLKDLGNPIMALVILTEPRPYVASATVLRRLAFLLIPLSVLFVKYYPELGRAYHNDGSPMYTGAGHQKNDLGLMCLLAAIPFVWEALYSPIDPRAIFTKTHKFLAVAIVGMLLWLLRISDSQTSNVCLILATLVMVLGRLRFFLGKADRMIGLFTTAVVSIWALDQLTDIRAFFLGLIGRNPTLTSRTDIWNVVMRFDANPLVGTGFMSFWSGKRMDSIQTMIGAEINQAHNGYVEQYLNLGYIGVALIMIIMIAGLLKVRRHMPVDPSGAMLRFCFIITALVYNFTEASFYGINNMWTLLLLGCIEVPRAHKLRIKSIKPAPQFSVRRPAFHKERLT